MGLVLMAVVLGRRGTLPGWAETLVVVSGESEARVGH
jgi:hypothetical protein